MSKTTFKTHWSEANQSYLAAHIARLKHRLGQQGDIDAIIRLLNDARAAMPAAASIDVIKDGFGLTDFERDTLLLCAGIEMDATLARLCAEAQGLNQRGYATFGLALGVLENPHWSALAPAGPLRLWRLVELDEEAGPVAGRLRIDERVLHFLAGIDFLDTRLAPYLRMIPRPAVLAEPHRQMAGAVIEALRENAAHSPVVILYGDDSDAQSDIAAEVAHTLGWQMHSLRAGDLPSAAAEVDALFVLCRREAILAARTLGINALDGEASKAAANLAERAGGTVFIFGKDASVSSRLARRVILRFAVNKPADEERKRLWSEALGSSVARVNGSIDAVASQFRLSATTILSTGKQLQSRLATADAPEALLWDACRTLGRSRLDDLAQPLSSSATWEDLVLPEPQKSILRQIAAHAKNRLTVYRQWGFSGKDSRGLGITALFAGESGTGKTMASEVLARELRLDLYRIDLSSVVSKYIGETERNLRRVFDAAEDSGAILLFDEADALFGKRSEVKDSHDRYANIEVSYLLQRMEAYSGLAILTTNMKAAIDTAFQRRLRFIVQFPFPDAPEREAIWKGIFPAVAPLDSIDFAKLARLHVSGGGIRNIAMNAAFLAADAGQPIGMAHLFQAAHGEASKRERPLSEPETRGWI